jgi:hypothetical protein
VKADISLAKVAMLRVLSKKASRMKHVVDRLTVDLAQHRYRDRKGRLKATVDQGIEAVRGARY